MTRNLVIKASAHNQLAKAMAAAHTVSSQFHISNAVRMGELDKTNLLFIDADSFDDSNILKDEEVQTALNHGIPIVISKPSMTLLTALSGFGIEGSAATIVVKGKGSYFYSTSFMESDVDSVALITASIQASEVESAEKEIRTTEAGSDSKLVAIEEIDLPKSVLELLNNVDHMEGILHKLSNSVWQNENIPENRTWTHYWAMEDWKSIVLSDPSEEKTKTQTARFRFTASFSLLAANTPVKTKVFNIKVGGTGFEPVASGQSLIRDNSKHRGWAQSLTFTEFVPTGNEFGNIEAYQPSNTSDAVTVTTGYSWDIGFTGGGSATGPEGSVSFSYSQNSSSSIATQDFETLADAQGNYGMRFYHNCHVVGGDTIIDARHLFENEWNDTMSKMFYYHFPDGDRVRSWPGLARTLLMPGSECVWYAKPTETRIGTMKFGGQQGLNYCYSKGGWNYCSSIKNSFLNNTIQIDMSRVNYDDVS